MKYFRFFRVLAASLGSLCTLVVFSAPIDVSKPRDAIPPNIAITANRPMVMLAASKDRTLFSPIYTDFEDLDGDGYVDTTFIPTFKYYGYFDSETCYIYDAAEKRFKPSSEASKVSQIISGKTKYKYTCSGKWSGNFLNWATMTRLDVIRKMMYGGRRKIDTTDRTVLERADLGHDAHAFVKYYKGTDIADYTPYSVDALKKSTGPNATKYAGLSICNRSAKDGLGGDPLMLVAKGNYKLWATVEGLGCNWGEGSNAATKSGGQSLGPKLATFYEIQGAGGIAHELNRPSKTDDGVGIYSEMVVRNEICVAGFKEVENCQKFGNTAPKPYGLFQEFGLPADGSTAAKAEFGMIGGSYDKNLTAGALRRNMGDMLDEINPTTGVFCHSSSAACDSSLADTRKTDASPNLGAGAIKAFDNIIIYGTGPGDYVGNKNKKASQLVDGEFPAWGNPIGEMFVQALEYYSGLPSSNPSSINDANSSMPVVKWRDPHGESDNDVNKKRTQVFGKPICRPMNVLVLSSSALSFDQDADATFSQLPNRGLGTLSAYTNKVGDVEFITNTVRSVAVASGSLASYESTLDGCSGKSVAQLANVIGICPDAPSTGGTYKVAGAALYANTSEIRTPPATVPSDLPPEALRVKTLAASLTGGSARIEVPIPVKGDPSKLTNKKVYITPEALSVPSGTNIRMPMSVLTFDAIAASPPGELPWGTFVVTWNDRLFGGDHDMDITGFLRYDVKVNNARSSGYDIEITTDIINVGMGDTGTYGYSVIGTNSDGRRLTHRHKSGDNPLRNPVPAAGYMCGETAYLTANNSTDGGACKVSCGNFDVFWHDSPKDGCKKNGDFRKVFPYEMVGVENVTLKDPLWYAGKYGNFTSAVKNDDGSVTNYAEPPDVKSWDNIKEDGSVGSDGVPDGYFLARRPDILAAQLRRALNAAVKSSNAAPATSSAQLAEDGFKYLVKFDTNSLLGTVEAFKLDAQGEFGLSPVWEAGSSLHSTHASNGGAVRNIITNNSKQGFAFRWGSLSSDYKLEMTSNGVNPLTDENAQIAINYIRGDQSKEGVAGLRERGTNLLGPVVNGSPWVQGPPSATFPGVSAEGYREFRNTHKDRSRLLWVAANDGMLHAFDSKSGSEVFAYVPGALANRLAEIPLQRGPVQTRIDGSNFVNGAEKKPSGIVWPYVDGSPFSADVKVGVGINAAWRTYVFGSLGRGGRAIYALDATSVNDLTESSAASVFKWQFTSDDDTDLGYIVGDISKHATTGQAVPVVKMNNGKFALLLGNGQKSTTGKTVLFIVYIDGPNSGVWTEGVHYRKIEVDSSSSGGLSMPRWEDIDGNGTADVAYAGDLKGNLWKFDLQNSDPTQWAVAYKSGTTNKPLYQATYKSGVSVTPLPITTAPQLLYMGKGGFMVTFATGNAFETGDFPNTTVKQRVYGVWDRGAPVVLDSRLAPRTYTRDADTGVVTVTSSTPLDWSQYDGWYMNLPGSGEAVLSDPSYDSGVLTFVGVRPNTATSACTATPNISLFTIEPISGKAERNTQGTTIVGPDKIVIAAKEINDQKVQVVNDRTKKPFSTSCKSGETGCTCVGPKCTKPAICTVGQRAKRVTGRSADAVICSSAAPRLQWREIPGLRTNQ